MIIIECRRNDETNSIFYGDVLLTSKMLSAICVNPFPLIVTLRSLAGSSPAISFLRSVDATGCGTVWAGVPVGSKEEAFGANGASIHNSRKFSRGAITLGILKSGTFGYDEIWRLRIFLIRSKAPLYPFFR